MSKLILIICTPALLYLAYSAYQLHCCYPHPFSYIVAR